jgi:hypothetical protein
MFAALNFAVFHVFDPASVTYGSVLYSFSFAGR